LLRAGHGGRLCLAGHLRRSDRPGRRHQRSGRLHPVVDGVPSRRHPSVAEACTFNREKSSMHDPYLELIKEQCPSLADTYNRYAEQRPIMLVDVQESVIHAYPYEEFVMLLDAPSRHQVEVQYRRAIDGRQMVLFVRDTDNKVFQSYTLALED